MMPRSFLYVPGVRPELFDKAVDGEADAVILDLEDSVPWPDKARARELLTDWLEARPPGGSATEIWVRINAEAVPEDVRAATRPPVAGLMVASAEPATLRQAAAALDEREPAAGLVSDSIGLIGLVETARGLLSLAEMAAHPRLRAFGFGEVDLLADLRIERGPSTEGVVDRLRSELVLHSAAAGIEAPVAPTSTAFRELDAFRTSAEHLFALGFRSRTAIHPAQVPVIHDALRPDEADLARAREVLARFEAAGGGITQDEAGQMVDAATIRRAHEVIARAGDGGAGS